MKTRSIKEMTYEEFLELAKMATGGYIDSYGINVREVECGGYGWRRRIEWEMNLEGYLEYHYFQISSEKNGDLGWRFQCKSTSETNTISALAKSPEYIDDFKLTRKPNWGRGHMIIILHIHKMVDFCREKGLDIENVHNRYMPDEIELSDISPLTVPLKFEGKTIGYAEVCPESVKNGSPITQKTVIEDKEAWKKIKETYLDNPIGISSRSTGVINKDGFIGDIKRIEDVIMKFDEDE